MSQSNWGEGVNRGDPFTNDQPPQTPDRRIDPEGYTDHLESVILSDIEARMAGPDVTYSLRITPDGARHELTEVFSGSGEPVRVESNLVFGNQPVDLADSTYEGIRTEAAGGNNGNNNDSADMQEESPNRRLIVVTAALVGALAVVGGISWHYFHGPAEEPKDGKQSAADRTNSAGPSAGADDPTAATPALAAPAATASALDIKFKVPGCDIKSSIVHVQGNLDSFLLEHLQQDDTQYRYNIPAQTKGDVAIMLCDTDPTAVTLDQSNSTVEQVVYNYDVSKFNFSADLTGLETGVAKQKPHEAYLDIKNNISDKAVKVDGRHASQDRRTVAPALIKDMEVLTRQRLATDAVKAIIGQAPGAFENYCRQLAIDQGYPADAIKCVQTGTFTPAATEFAKGFQVSELGKFARPDDPSTRPVFVRAPYDQSTWLMPIESTVTGAAQ